MDTTSANMYEIADLEQNTSRQYEMQDAKSNEEIIEPSAEQLHAPSIDEEDHSLLDNKPLSTTSKMMASIDASVIKNRSKLRGMSFIAAICVAVLLIFMLTLVAITVAAASYANQSARQDDFDKLSNQFSELMSGFNSLNNHLNQIASESQNSNVSFILSHLDATIQDKIELLQTQIISNLPIAINCGAGEWYHVAHLNMYNRTEKCPAVWTEYNYYNTSRVRACGRPNSTEGSCPGTLYTTSHQYSKICGRVVGYQEDSPDGFVDSNANNASQIYMDGVSITYGTSRQHVWSYVAGVTESSASHTPNNCPCSAQGGTGPPSFVGDHYYCESGNPTDIGGSPVLLVNDPLWDGHHCEGSCCSGANSPPWFSVQLPAPTMDMIEVRICGNEGTENEDTPIALLDIYVQ